MKKKRKTVNNTKNKRIIAAVIIIALIAAGAMYFLGGRTQFFDDGINKVCLDAGHGGSDSGAVSKDGKRFEKDDDLALTLKIKENLEAQGVTVVLTRDDDSYVSLGDRCRIANRKRCDLFVSVHRNSADSGASGIEAWISNTAGTSESRIAGEIVKAVCAVTEQANRGVKRGYRGNAVGNYYVNSDTKMPSLLLECGFISNESDNSVFDSTLDETAKAIADAIVNEYFN